MFKKNLRAIYLLKRQQLSQYESNIAFDFFYNILIKKIDFTAINNIATYLPIEKFAEIDALKITQKLQQQYPVLKIYVPKINVNNTMEFYLLNKNTNFAKNKWGVKEPVNQKAIPPINIQALIIPLLCFTPNGNRVGYGKGFYDNYLKRCHPNVLKIGLSYFEPINLIIDVNPNDVPLTWCITPTTVYEF